RVRGLALSRPALPLEPRSVRPTAGDEHRRSTRAARRLGRGARGPLAQRRGSGEDLEADSLIAAEERGLRLLAAASVVLAAALVAFRLQRWRGVALAWVTPAARGGT